jgi:hypothetical protein
MALGVTAPAACAFSIAPFRSIWIGKTQLFFMTRTGRERIGIESATLFESSFVPYKISRP